MVLPQGLAALLVQGLSGCRPEEVAKLTPDWISTIGLQQSLTPSRNNGFLNMFGLMRHKAAQLLKEQVRLHSPVNAALFTFLNPSQAFFHPPSKNHGFLNMFGLMRHKGTPAAERAGAAALPLCMQSSGKRP